MQGGLDGVAFEDGVANTVLVNILIVGRCCGTRRLSFSHHHLDCGTQQHGEPNSAAAGMFLSQDFASRRCSIFNHCCWSSSS